MLWSTNSHICSKEIILYSAPAFRLLAGAGRSTCFIPADPLGQGLPIRVVLGGKLPASTVHGGAVAARLRGQRMLQKRTRGRVAGNHKSRYAVEVDARLLLGPKG